MDSEVTFYALATTAVAVASYIFLFPKFPDVAPVLLHNQASIAAVRKDSETAIYRGTVAGHGSSLINGLAIAGDKPYTTRDGDFNDFWQLLKDTKVGVAEKQGESYKYEPFAAGEFEKLVSSIGQKFAEWSKDQGTVAIVLPNCLEAFVSVFAAVLYHVPVVLVPYREISEFQAHEAVRLSNAAVVVSTKDYLDNLKLSKEDVVFVCTDDGPSHIKWSDLEEQAKHGGKSIPRYEDLEYPVSLAFPGFDDLTAITKFTSKNIAAAVAAHIKALPKSEQWTSKDSVLSCTSSLSIYSLVHSLAAVVQGSTLVFPRAVDRNLVSVIADIKPTVVITDDRCGSDFLKYATTLSWLAGIRVQIAQSTLSRGNLPSAALSQFSSVRQIFSAHDAHEFKGISTHETNLIRALTGAKLIHALTTPCCAAAVAQTHVQDYRSGAPEYIPFGSALPSNELVLRDHGAYSTANRQGQLYVRGFASARTDWSSTGLIATFDTDGTLKLFF